MVQQEQQANVTLEDIVSALEDSAEKKLEKYVKRGLGDYTIVITVEATGIDRINVTAEIELRSSVLEKEVLEGIIDEVLLAIKDKADEVIKVRKGRGHIKESTKP